MHTNILTTAAALSDDGLLARLPTLAADGYGSLFSYCRQAPHLSEDAACNRIDVARACRRCLEIPARAPAQQIPDQCQARHSRFRSELSVPRLECSP
jgi:hypothetical protein